MIIFLFSLFAAVILGKNDDTYRAAIVAFTKRFYEAKDYIPFVEEAKEGNVEIVVFPEMGLISAPENVTVGIVPCDSEKHIDGGVMKTISCAAKKNEIYIQINIIELGCLDGHWNHDTLIDFDRTGEVINRWRKSEISPEFEWLFHPGTTTPKLNYGFFDTDFGVRMGTFICSEITFGQPSTDLLEKYGITDFSYSADWLGFPPASAAVVQSGWSRYWNVNLLAANINHHRFPSHDSDGAGIYSCGRPLVPVYYDHKTPKVLFADVPMLKKRGENVVESDTEPVEDEDIKSKKVEKGRRPQKVEYEHVYFKAAKGFEKTYYFSISTSNCTINVNVSESTENDNFIVFLTKMNFWNISLYLEICAVMNCGKSNEKDCGQKINPPDMSNVVSTTTFNSVSVETIFKDEQRWVLPVLAKTNKQLYPWGTLDVKRDGKYYAVSAQNGDLVKEPLLWVGNVGLPVKMEDN